MQPVPVPIEPQYLPPVLPSAASRRPRRSSPIVAPLLALLGLAMVAAVSYLGIDYINAALDENAVAAESSAGPQAAAAASLEPAVGAASESPDPGRPTSEPTAEPTQEPEAEETLAPSQAISASAGSTPDIKGSILFTRYGGDVWVATGKELRNLTSTNPPKLDISPTWSGDGRYVYFIRRSVRTTDNARREGKYTLYPGDLLRIDANGSKRKVIYDSLIQDSRGLWFTHVLQPSASSNGNNVAVVSDGPDGSGPVVLHVVNARTGRMRKVPVPSQSGLGHNDPDFSADGTRIAYTYNANAGTKGAPRIGIFKCKSRANCSKGTNRLLKPGFANPSWSPDGKWLAVEKTDGTGRDIAIIGAGKGDVRVRLTTDGDSFAPEVSPDGDQIAYLKRDGTNIDLRVMTLDVDARGYPTLLSDRAITTDGLVDSDSNPSWFIPKRELKNPDLASDPDDEVDPDASGEPADGSNASEGAPPPPA